MGRRRLSARGYAITITAVLTPELLERLQLASAASGDNNQSSIIRAALHAHLSTLGHPPQALPLAPVPPDKPQG